MLRAMIVDDEAPARSELRYLLEQTGRIESIVEASSVREAIERYIEDRVDVMFLDISMPKTDGMQLAEGLRKYKTSPAIVFVTAYSEYALDAFNVDAVDYLMKPVEMDRLNQALDKVQGGAKPASQPKAYIERIPVEKAGRKILLPIDQIRYIEAKDDYSCIYTDNDHYLSTISLAKFENDLSSKGFFRAHRSYIVNLQYIDSVDGSKSGNGNLKLTISGIKDKKISVSRRRAGDLKKKLNI